jgi:hypothetical protein
MSNILNALLGRKVATAPAPAPAPAPARTDLYSFVRVGLDSWPIPTGHAWGACPACQVRGPHLVLETEGGPRYLCPECACHARSLGA